MITAPKVPADSLLGAYVASGAYTDCYATEIRASVSHAQFVEAFYTTPLFKLERLLLRLFVSRPSSDAQARQLAQDQSATFAAWSVEARAGDQLLLAAGRTRSWLMVRPGTTAPHGTALFFGSAVVPRRSSSGRGGGMGLVFSALLGFHKLYSRALLLSARVRLQRQRAAGHVERDDA